MLTELKLQHWKAFEEVNVEFRPLTIFIGKNSSGKSTIFEALNIMRQTVAESGNRSGSFLKLNGKLASVGSPANLFHNGNSDNPAVIEISLKDSFFKTEAAEILRPVVRALPALLRILVQNLGLTVSPALEPYLNYKGGSLQVPLHFEAPLELIKTVKSLKINEETQELLLESLLAYYPVIFSKSKIRLKDLLDDLERTCRVVSFSLKVDESSKLTARFDLVLSDLAQVDLSCLRLSVDDVVLLLYSTDHSAASTSKSEVVAEKIQAGGGQSDPSSRFAVIPDTIISPGKSLRGCIQNSDRQNWHSMPWHSRLIRTLVEAFFQCVFASFQPENLRHVPAYRPRPKRFYFSDADSDMEVSTFSYLKALSDDEECREKFNKLMKKFDVSIEVQDQDDIFLKATVIIPDSRLSLDITDVGFGISQVFPVLMSGLLAQNGSVTMVEQPEVHLHPSLQAELADFFSEHSREPMGQPLRRKGPLKHADRRMFLIETHSEYLLNRIAFLLASGRDPKSKHNESSLTGDEVMVYYVEADKATRKSVVKILPNPESGTYQIPDDFKKQELEEFLKSL